jgi:DNA-directed RNA polymerase subunit N (RpoN/RPB10)
MEAELVRGGRTLPGLASRDHGAAALAVRETPDYSGERPGSRGLFHTGRGGGADGAGDLEVFSLNTAIQAVGEGNYGRLGPDQQRRYTDANAETMFAEPATGGEPDEQPGAMPEIFPSEGFALGGNIDRCWTCRSMVTQAWGHYGTIWPVVHQQLGVRPDLGRGRVAVVPQVPDGQPSVQGEDVRLGRGAIDVVAAHDGAAYTTRVNAARTPARVLELGVTLPDGASVAAVRLDGRAVRRWRARATNRGLEVTVRARPHARHALEVTTR